MNTDWNKTEFNKILKELKLSNKEIEKAIDVYDIYSKADIFPILLLTDQGANFLKEYFTGYEEKGLSSIESIVENTIQKYYLNEIGNSEEVLSKEDLYILRNWIPLLSIDYSTKEYLQLYSSGKDFLRKAPDWKALLNHLVENLLFATWKTLAEVFIRLIEYHYKTLVKDAKHIQELTGLKKTGLSQDLKAELERLFPNNKYNELEGIFTLSNILRYEVYLTYVLQVTKSFDRINNIDPGEFYLPKEAKQEAISKVIFFSFYLGEGLSIRPTLREVANSIKAPYSVVLKAYYSFNDN